jgi:hypothetical protein
MPVTGFLISFIQEVSSIRGDNFQNVISRLFRRILVVSASYSMVATVLLRLFIATVYELMVVIILECPGCLRTVAISTPFAISIEA